MPATGLLLFFVLGKQSCAAMVNVIEPDFVHITEYQRRLKQSFLAEERGDNCWYVSRSQTTFYFSHTSFWDFQRPVGVQYDLAVLHFSISQIITNDYANHKKKLTYFFCGFCDARALLDLILHEWGIPMLLVSFHDHSHQALPKKEEDGIFIQTCSPVCTICRLLWCRCTGQSTRLKTRIAGARTASQIDEAAMDGKHLAKLWRDIAPDYDIRLLRPLCGRLLVVDTDFRPFLLLPETTGCCRAWRL